MVIMIENAKIESSTIVETTLNTGSVPSCLRNGNGTCRKKPLNRKVCFPEDDKKIVTGYMEPANPWEFAYTVNKDELTCIYNESCKKHAARPLSPVIDQIQKFDFFQERNECFDLKGEFLGPQECESLEEVLKRVQFNAINLETTSLDDEASAAIFDMLEYYESAIRLNIAGNHSIGVRGWQACCHLIKRTKCLEELDARNTTLNEQYMPILSRALRLSPQLHVLKLENCNLSGRPLTILAAALKLNTALKELYLGENYLSVNDAVQLSSLLKANSTLQLLDISNNNIQDGGLGHLSEGLTEQNNSGTGLAVLVLWNNHLTRNASSHLAKLLTSSKTLEMLNIGQNVLSNEVLFSNKDVLQKNKSLLRLGMQSTHLTCEGAIALAEIIADNAVLQRIDLRDNNLQVAGLMALSLSMKVNLNVTRLDLDDTPRRKHSMGPSLEKYIQLVAEIREYCQRNETIAAKEVKAEDMTDTTTVQVISPEKRPRLGNFASRKISLTCETLMRSATTPSPEPVNQHLTEPKRSSGRLRSPAPSPIPSPVASPSPTRSRFQVSRVSESESPVTPPSTSPNTFFGSGTGSRFKVTVVDNPVSITPTPVVAGNNVTIGFDASTLSLSPTPTQIPESPLTIVSSLSTSSSTESCKTIPLLFPTPMPSPVPSPTLSCSLSSEHSSFTEKANNVIGENKYVTDNNSQPLDIGDSSQIKAIDIPNSDSNLIKIENLSSDSEDILNSPSVSVTSLDSVTFTRDKKYRSDSEESDREIINTKSKLPKATDSLDLTTFQAIKQPSPRSRKLSWVQTSSMRSAVTSQDDSSKQQSSLEKLLSLFNPFSRQRTEEEPQLQSVPELSENRLDVSDNTLSASEPNAFSVTIERVVQGMNEIKIPSCLTSVNTKLEKIIEKQTNCDQGTQNLNTIAADKCTVKCDEQINICNVEHDPSFVQSISEIKSDMKCASNADNLNNNDRWTEIVMNGTKCETWPQGRTGLAKYDIIHQAQSKSDPCVAVFFLQGQVTTDISVDIKKLSPSPSEDKLDTANNFTWAP